MATPPPPKPKPGSLKDRIAAFESSKQNAPTPSAAAPPVRPKPVTREWKPKPRAEEEVDEKERDSHKGMSASDAKESIKGGFGSLKERMAALQGKGAFGASAPTAGPPVAPKPKPVVPRKPVSETLIPQDESKAEEQSGDTDEMEHTQPPSTDDASSALEASTEASTEPENEPEVDEEAKRRAAIAARMARLGGAKIGMAPPVLGRKPVPKKEEGIVPPAEGDKIEQEKGIPIPGFAPPPEVSSEQERKDGSSKITSPPLVQSPPEEDLVKSPTPSVSSASSAKLVGPKRAGPPRKKKPTPQKVEEVPDPKPEEVELPPSRKTTNEMHDEETHSEEPTKEPTEIKLPPSRRTTVNSTEAIEEEPHHDGEDDHSPTTPQDYHSRQVSLGPDVDESDVATPPPRSVTPSSISDTVSDAELQEDHHLHGTEEQQEDNTTPGEEHSVNPLAPEHTQSKLPPPPLPTSTRPKYETVPESPVSNYSHEEPMSPPSAYPEDGDKTFIADEEHEGEPAAKELDHEDDVSHFEAIDHDEHHLEAEEVREPEREELTPVHGSFPPTVHETQTDEHDNEHDEEGAKDIKVVLVPPTPLPHSVATETKPELDHELHTEPEPEPEPEVQEEVQEDEEEARKRRMREKMAKLGGFNPFGAPARPLPRSAGSEEGNVEEEIKPPSAPIAVEEEEGEEERRNRIREKMTKMGGFNPFGGGGPIPPRRDSIPVPIAVNLPEEEEHRAVLRPGRDSVPVPPRPVPQPADEEEDEQMVHDDESDEAPHEESEASIAEETDEEERPPPPRRLATKAVPEVSGDEQMQQDSTEEIEEVAEVEEEERPPPPRRREEPKLDEDEERPPPPPRRQATIEVPELDQEEERPPPPPRRQATIEVPELDQEEERPSPPPRRQATIEVPELDQDEERLPPPPRRKATVDVPEFSDEDVGPPPPPRPHVTVNSTRTITEEGIRPPPPRPLEEDELATESTLGTEEPEEPADLHEDDVEFNQVYHEHEDATQADTRDNVEVGEGESDDNLASQANDEEEMPAPRIMRPIPPLPPRIDSLGISNRGGYESTTSTPTPKAPVFESRLAAPPKRSTSPASSVASLRSSSSSGQSQGRKVRPPIPNPPNPRRSIPSPPRAVSAVPRRLPSTDDSTPRSNNGHVPSLSINSVDLPSLSPSNQTEFVEHQPPLNDADVVDEGSADPIDPMFYSPKSPTPPSLVGSREASPAPPVATQPAQEAPSNSNTEEDEETARRRTIAERMARLGGIKFGAAPPIPRRQGSGSSPPRTASNDRETEQEEETLSEEAERARRQAIAARLAGQGGLRIGMGMYSSPPPPPRMQPPPVEERRLDQSVSSMEHSDEVSQSDDGVKVEAEESELEEVSKSDYAEEEAPPPPPPPPPPPSRVSRSPSVRPPVPAAPKPGSRKSSGGARATSPIRNTSSTTIGPNTEFVMVEPDAQPLPPPRPPRPPPSRSSPPPSAPSFASRTQSNGESWELPNIPSPSLDFSTQDMDLSQSSSTDWGEDSTMYPQPSEKDYSTIRAAAPPAAPSKSQQPLTAEELLMLWGRIGTQVHNVASILYQKSTKAKAVIGDGSFIGFVNAVLREVRGAPPLLPHPSMGYGHSIYSQNGTTITRRTADISPGDLVLFENCRFHGRKGLQSYNINVGASGEDDAVGIINEVEGKKHKIKVFMANQHVGGPSVENTSYRLEELKSGSVKIYRVPEA